MSTATSPAMRRPRAILFDWDNTLIDSWAAIHDAQNHTFAQFGMPPWTMEDIRRQVRGSMRDSYPKLFGDRWREAGEIFYARFAERHMDMLKPVSGAAELLDELSVTGIYLAVVSNKKGDYLRSEATRLGWERYFGRMVGAFDAVRDKPSVEPVDLALTGSGIDRGTDVWFVGDADIDLECARNSGCIPVLVREEGPLPGEFVACPPAVHVRSCNALCELVRELWAQ